MHNRAIVAVFFTLLLISMLVLVFNIQSVKTSDTIHTGADDPIDPPTAPTRGKEGFVTQSSIDWWPMFHHDLNHTGHSTSTTPDTNETPWNYRTGSYVTSSPAVVDGMVFVGSGDNNVYALNATTGTQIWNYTTNGPVNWASPAVAGGLTYVGSNDQNVYALNATTGAKVWNYTTNGAVYSSPAVVDGVVYEGSTDGKVYALNATTGAEVWNHTTSGEVWSSPALANGKVYVGSNDYNVYCLDALTGVKVWNYTTGAAVYSSPTFDSGMIFVGSCSNSTYALNASTGALIWSYKTNSYVYSSPAVANGKVYVGSGNIDETFGNGAIYCLDASSGDLIWNYTTGGWVESSPAVAAGIVFVGSNDHSVYGLNAATGTLVWSFRTSDWVFSSPAVVDGVVYVGSLDGHIYAGRSIDVYLWNSIEPAPMGIADYGIGPSGPYEYATKSFVGTVTIASLLTNRSSDYIVSFQLNVEFEFNTSQGQYVFWMQNTATVRTFGSILTLENFGSNVWNWTKFFAQIDPSGISGKGQFGTPQDPYGYLCRRDGNFTPFNRTTPITITLNVTSEVSPSGEPTVSFAYDIGDGLITYDTITFTNVTGLTSSGFKVNGFGLNPVGLFCNAALILGGFLVTTDVLSDVQLQLEYWNGHNYQVVPNAYNFGTNTAETIDNVLCGFSHHPGNGRVFAEILPGAGQLGELYNQFQTGVIDIISPLASGTLYVTNASDPNAAAWKIPFVSGEVTITLYPGCYHLQLHNQYGELYDQGNFTVSAGHILHLQAPWQTYDVTIAAHCITECNDVGVAITEDGAPTGWNTPYTFRGLTVTHTFTVLGTDASGHSFKQWGTGETSTTITVSSGGTYTAYYRTPPVHDVAVTNVKCSKTVVGQGYSQNITVTVLDPGDYPENFNVSVLVDAGINDGLVGYWSFDEGSGTTAHDTSGNQNDGTIYGANWTGGKFEKALSFDGLDDYVDVPSSASLNNISDAVTIAAWVKLEQVPAEAYEFIEAGGYSYVAYAYVADPAGVRFNFGRCTAPGVGDDLEQEFWKQYNATLPYLPYDQWYYVVWMYDSDGYAAIYVNGNSYANTTLMSGEIYNYEWGLKINGRALHKGIVDELRIYNRTLNQQEITAVAGTGAFQTQEVALSSGSSTTLTFHWNTTGFAKGNYTISAYAWPVLSETDTTDNTLNDGWAIVTIPGDFNGDFKVGPADFALLAVAYGSTPDKSKWNPNCDVNDDDKVGPADFAQLSAHYGQHYP